MARDRAESGSPHRTHLELLLPKSSVARTPRFSCTCYSLHSNYMLNRGYAYTTIISRKYHGQTLLSHLASLYPH